MRCWWWTASTASAWVCATVLFAPHAPLAAQSPADRAAIGALRDSLAAMTSADAVARVPMDWRDGRRGPMARLRAGFVRLRLGTLAADPAALNAALFDFDVATHDAPAWPYPWFGRGLAKLYSGALPGATSKAQAGQALGESFYAAFMDDVRATATRDPVFPPLVQFLTQLLVPQRDRTQPDLIVKTLALAAARGPVAADVHLVLGRAYRTAADDSTALDEFDAYLAAGGDTSVALLETARSLAGTGQLEAGAADYLTGAEHLGGEARSPYRDDLAWIGNAGELAAFDSLPADSTGPWIERFWARRDAESPRPAGERLAEHLRRWNYVYRHFRVIHPERRTQFAKVRVLDIGPCSDGGTKALDDYRIDRPDRPDDFRRKERVLDDRAPVYMRHGAPWQRIRAAGGAIELADAISAGGLGQSSAGSGAEVAAGTGSGESDGRGTVPTAFAPSVMGEVEALEGVESSEAWLYWFAGATRLFYFASSGANGPGPTTLYTEPPMSPALFTMLAGLDPVFGKAAGLIERNAMIPLTAIPLRCQAEIGRSYARTRGDVTTGVLTDSHTLLFRRQLGPIVQSYALGRPSAGTSRVLIAFAVPGERLVATARPDGRPGVAYRISLRVSAVDSVRGTVRWLDTTRVFVAADSVPAGAFLTGLTELAVPSGTYAVRVALFDPGTGTGGATLRPSVSLDDGAPALSDLILSTDQGGLEWANNGDPVRLNVSGAFRRGATAGLYYETYGLQPGRAYRTTIAIAPARNPKKAGVSLSFTETATASTAHVRRLINLSTLSAGQYELRVTLTDTATGAVATRDQLLNIVAR